MNCVYRSRECGSVGDLVISQEDGPQTHQSRVSMWIFKDIGIRRSSVGCFVFKDTQLEKNNVPIQLLLYS